MTAQQLARLAKLETGRSRASSDFPYELCSTEELEFLAELDEANITSEEQSRIEEISTRVWAIRGQS